MAKSDFIEIVWNNSKTVIRKTDIVSVFERECLNLWTRVYNMWGPDKKDLKKITIIGTISSNYTTKEPLDDILKKLYK